MSESGSEQVKHLRLVHFALLTSCLAIGAASQFDKSSEVQRATLDMTVLCMGLRPPVIARAG